VQIKRSCCLPYRAATVHSVVTDFYGNSLSPNKVDPNGNRNSSSKIPYPSSSSIYMYKRDCLYLCTCVPLSAIPISANHINSGKVLNKSLTLPTQPPNPRGTTNSKTLADHSRKNLCNVKCSDGYPKNFCLGSTGPQLASLSIDKRVTVCTYVPF